MIKIKKLQFTIFLLITSVLSIKGQTNIDTSLFISPVDIPIYLSGNFGEIRGTHFHTGIDIKTQGVQGKNIYSIADGYVSRIKVSPGSYGYALYITHPQGYVSVYGHLQKFNKPISKYVIDYQYENEKFSINIFPPKDRFILKQGDLIGFSGNTGSSMGPHLHFEIRNAKNEHPLNPLLFNFDIKDDISPRMYSINIYPLDFQSHVNIKFKEINIKTQKQNGSYKLVGNNTIPVYGEIGLGIECNDFLNNSHNKCGVYSIELRIDSKLIYSTELDDLDFSEQGYVKSHIDYAFKIESRKTIQKSFIDPNNKSSIYKEVNNKGIINIHDTLEHIVNYTLIDAYNNISNLKFILKGVQITNTDSLTGYPVYNKAMPLGIKNEFIDNGINISIPANALYNDLFFTYSAQEANHGSYSKLHNIHNKLVPLHKFINLKITPTNLPSGQKDKAVIARINESKNSFDLISYGGKWIEDQLKIRTKEFGQYGIFIDSISPTIKPLNISEGKDMSGTRRIKVSIKDDFTGISKYEGSIDNKWVLFKYDAKNNLIFYNFSDKKITSNSNHTLRIRVYDNVDNMSEVEIGFYY